MKKVILFAAAGLFVLASCKKDYTCECTSTNGGATATASTTINDTKKNAEQECEAQNESAGTYTKTCKIQ